MGPGIKATSSIGLLENKSLARRDFLKISAFSTVALINASACTSQANTSDRQAKRMPKMVLTNFKMFDNRHRNLLENQVIVIEKGRIRAVEPRGDLAGYKGYHQIDLGGRAVLPGLIDNHVHITVPFVTRVNPGVLLDMNDQIELNFRNCIRNGVTTVRDVGGFPGKIYKFRAMADNGEIPGPRVISSLSPIAARKGDKLGAPEQAPYFTNPFIKWMLGGNYAERPINVKEIEQACNHMLGMGAQWLKTLYQTQPHTGVPRSLPVHSDEGYKKILEIGRKNGIKCAIHQPFVKGFIKGVDLGYNTLEHTPKDRMIPEEAIERFIRQDMAILPTLMVYGDFLILEELRDLVKNQGSEYLLSSPQEQVVEKLDYMIELSQRTLSDEEIRPLDTDPTYIQKQFPIAAGNIARMHKMGAKIGIGTDIGGSFATFFGRYTTELKHMSSVGISNFDVLCMATSINAGILDMQDKIGTIEKGKLADIIAVKGDPLEDLSALDRVDLVMKGGIIIQSDNISI